MLIVDGNSVYEIDCDCARKKGLYGEVLGGREKHKEVEMHSDTGGMAVEKSVYTGKNVVAAVLDTGIYPHPDFGNRIVGWYDAVAHRREPCDWNGHGTQEGVTPAAAGRVGVPAVCGRAAEG